MVSKHRKSNANIVEAALFLVFEMLMFPGIWHVAASGVVIPDANLEAALRDALSKPTGDLAAADMLSLNAFSAVERGIADLTGLEYCTNLTRLDLSHNQISNIDLLKNLTNLEQLYMGGNTIRDISPLEDLANLTRLSIFQCHISDINALTDLTDLTYLNLNKNEISDISVLSNHVNLTHLLIGGNKISDISSLANLNGLIQLSLFQGYISDITALKNLTNLTYLNLNKNQIGDISVLGGLTRLAKLHIWDNQISDISVLANLISLEELDLHNNHISDITALVDNVGIGDGDEVDLRDNPLNHEAYDIHIPDLQTRGVNLSFDPQVVTVKIYVDESRSLQLGGEIWKGLSENDGYISTRSMDLIEYEQLKCYDVMIVRNYVETLSYSEEELEAIRRFVEDGGGLLVIGNVIPHRKTKATYSNGKWSDLMPLPEATFSMNQIAAMFQIAFTNAVRTETAHFNTQSPVNDGSDLSLLEFEQPLSPLICHRDETQILIDNFDMPVAVSLDYGEGRAIFCGAHRLFVEYGSYSDRKLGRTDAIVEVQKDLLDNWLRWLSYRKSSQQLNISNWPDDIPPRVKLSSQMADFYCIPQLQNHTERVMEDWTKIWPSFSGYVGVSSPLEFLPGVKPGEKLSVFVRAAEQGGLSGGTRVHIAAMGEEWRPAAILSHEVGHKLLGGVNTSVSEGYAEWMNCRGLRAMGYFDAAEEKMSKHLNDFHRVDPTGKELDIVDSLLDAQEFHACMGKWMWILSELERKYGEDIIRRYVACLRTGLELSGAHNKVVDGKRVKLSMDDIVHFMSKASGEDLFPWFGELGITVHPSENTGKAEMIIPAWDVNQDGITDIQDLMAIARAFGSDDFADILDVNRDGAVDILDLVIVATHYGETADVDAPAAL